LSSTNKQLNKILTAYDLLLIVIGYSVAQFIASEYLVLQANDLAVAQLMALEH